MKMREFDDVERSYKEKINSIEHKLVEKDNLIKTLTN